ncbi:MAG: hypothetical protein IKQ25_02960 [Lachnospiraceae bacterium]|nr:hypothetical protein [Lachnospiraceae bacterium]
MNAVSKNDELLKCEGGFLVGAGFIGLTGACVGLAVAVVLSSFSDNWTCDDTTNCIIDGAAIGGTVRMLTGI